MDLEQSEVNGVRNRVAVFRPNGPAREALRKLLATSSLDRELFKPYLYLKYVGYDKLNANTTFPELVRALYRFKQLEPRFSRAARKEAVDVLSGGDRYAQPPPLQLENLRSGTAKSATMWVDKGALYALHVYYQLVYVTDDNVYTTSFRVNPVPPTNPDRSLYTHRLDFVPAFLRRIMQENNGGFRDMAHTFYDGTTEINDRNDAVAYVDRLLEEGYNPALEMVSIYFGDESPVDSKVTSFFSPVFSHFHNLLSGPLHGDTAEDEHLFEFLAGGKDTGYRPWVKAANTSSELRRYYIQVFNDAHWVEVQERTRWRPAKRIYEELIPIWEEMEGETTRRAAVMGALEDPATRVPVLPVEIMARIFGNMNTGGDDGNDVDEGGAAVSAERSRALAAMMEEALNVHKGDVDAAAAYLLAQ